MLDMCAWPKNSAYSELITCPGDGTNGWVVWNAPSGIGMIAYVLCGGAGGGGGGCSAAAGTSRGGGGGGGGGGMWMAVIPKIVLPDTLYIMLGAGGAGGAADSNGSSGGISYISVAPSTSQGNLITSASVGGYGGKGTTTAGGLPGGWPDGGNSEGILAPFKVAAASKMAILWQYGGTGGYTTAGGSKVWSTGVPYFCPGGAGGGGASAGGTSYAGGGWSASAGELPASIPGGVAPGGDGIGGMCQILENKLFHGIGGAGGAGHATASAGAGGGGAPGCGGGGGGGGVAGGTGGKGGDGFVIITAW